MLGSINRIDSLKGKAQNKYKKVRREGKTERNYRKERQEGKAGRKGRKEIKKESQK